MLSSSAILSLRLRVLLAMLAAAGAGVYLTYSAAMHAAGPLASDEAAGGLRARLDLAAALTEAGMSAASAQARALASLPASALAGGLPAGRTHGPELTGAWLQDADGRVLASYRGRASARQAAAAQSKNLMIGPPLWNSGLEYEITAPASGGTLRCRFRAVPLPREAYGRAGQETSYIFALRRGNTLRTAGPRGSSDVPIKSRQAELFLPALEGREGSAVSSDGSTLFAFRRLPAADWIMTASTPYAAAAANGERMTGNVRLAALLIFALLAISCFFGAALALRPLRRTARAAAALLEDCGRQQADPDEQPSPELIDQALREASACLRSRDNVGARLEAETEKLRGEEADLKNQNAELEKLNQYLNEREAMIAELKGELAKLKEKAASER